MNIDIKEIRKILADRTPVPENGFRHYSVLIPLVWDEEGTRLLYEIRARDLDRQPGEICFPGGMVEEGESFADCALRETEEEIGLPAECVELLPELTTIYGVGRFAMHCFPGIVDAKATDDLLLNEEVDEVFTVPVQKLLDMEVEMYHARLIQEGPEDFPYERVTGGDSYEWSRLSSPVPVYDVGEHVIWGLTGRATYVFLKVIKGEEG